MKKLISCIFILLFVCTFPFVAGAVVRGKVSVIPESSRVQSGQKSSVRLIYQGASINAAFIELKYPEDVITKPVMSESVSGVTCEIAEGVIKIVFVKGELETEGAVRLCKLDFEVLDTAAAGTAVNFSFQSCDAAVDMGVSVAAQQLETVNNPFVVTPPVEGTRLAGVEITGAGCIPGFSPEVREYQATVPSSVGVVTVNAVAQNPEAVIEGTGEIVVNEKNRRITVTVINPDGQSFDYHFTFSVDTYNVYKSSAVWKFISKNSTGILLVIAFLFFVIACIRMGIVLHEKKKNNRRA